MQTVLDNSSSVPNVSSFAATMPGKLLIGLAATVVVAAAAHVSIPLPFTPIPLTLQPLAVLGVGLALGPMSGFLAMLAYLAEGASGLPVFSPTGPGGIAQILGPTGGFLMIYPIVAAIVGGLTRLLVPYTSRFLAAFVSGTLAVAVLFFCGASWWMHLAHLPLNVAWSTAVLPFLPGEAIKVAIAAGVYSTFGRTSRIQ
jgi:biotin transport system substrate-specific component